jgi:hypothetical protein
VPPYQLQTGQAGYGQFGQLDKRRSGKKFIDRMGKS